MKKILNFTIVIVMGVLLSACTSMYKEKVLKEELQNTKEKVEKREQEITSKEDLEKKLEQQIKENATLDSDVSSNEVTNQEGIVSSEEQIQQQVKQEEVQNRIDKETQIINKYKSQLYSIQSSFESKVGGLLQSAKSEYEALPEDKRGNIAKAKIGLKYYKKARGLEGDCDNKVYAVLSKMRAELKNNNYSTASADTLKSYYEGEKDRREAYYMSMLKGN